jgi:hypothetical protein
MLDEEGQDASRDHWIMAPERLIMSIMRCTCWRSARPRSEGSEGSEVMSRVDVVTVAKVEEAEGGHAETDAWGARR